MMEPVEVPDEEHEQILERVAAIDVAKATGMVCTRVPDDSRPGRRVTRVWQVPATTNAIIELGEYLAAVAVEKVTLESTSDYWRPFYYLLEAAGLDVQLVNAREARGVPGRPKSDKLDCVWQAKLTERGMLRPSFVPPAQIRQLRDYTRLRVDLTRDRSRHAQRLEKLLEDALIKLSSVATDIMGVSGRAMIEALIAGERDPQVLAGLARGRMKVKHAALVQALTGRFGDHHGELARMLLDSYDALTAQIGTLTSRIEELIAAIPEARGVDAGGTTGPGAGEGPDAAVRSAVARLDEIPGVGRHAAQVILAAAWPGDERLTPMMTRRSTVDRVLQRAAAAEPRVTVRFGVKVTGLLTAPGRPSSRPPHVTGVRTSRGDLAADLVVDATGRRSRSMTGWRNSVPGPPPRGEPSAGSPISAATTGYVRAPTCPPRWSCGPSWRSMSSWPANGAVTMAPCSWWWRRWPPTTGSGRPATRRCSPPSCGQSPSTRPGST